MGSGLIHTVAGAAVVLTAWLAPPPIPLADLMMVELISLSADSKGAKKAPAKPEPAPVPKPTPEPEPEPAPKPPPPPPPDNPLWEQLDQAVTQTAPDTGVSVAEQFSKLAEEAPKPAPDPAPAPPPSDLGEWWKKQAQQTPTPEKEPEPAPPPKAPAIAPSLTDRWARLKKKDDPTPPPEDDKDELSRFWSKLSKNPKARQGKAQSSTATVRYLGQVERRITSKWSPPRLSESITQLIVVVAFSVHSHGGVSQLRVVRSSGVDVFDQAAARAVLLSAPMPPFPTEMTTPEEEIRFTFTLAPELLG